MRIGARHGPFQPHCPVRIALAMALLAPAGATAQTVVGRVLDQETMEPLAAAFVALETPDGQRQGGVLTRPDGRFVIRAASPGRYRLVARMIGYDSTPSAYLDLEAGVTIQRDLDVPVRAITLDGIQVTSGARCRPRPGAGPETARLWEEARKALEVASWVERSAVLRFQGISHQRVLDPRTLRVVESAETGWTGWSGRSPYASIPAEQLAEGGYVREDPEGEKGEIVYYAPDADVLLADLFLDSHCFHVAPAPRDEPELVGLAFEPVRQGGPPDIRGVLWLDRGTAELRRLDFSYTSVPGLPAGLRDVATGRVEFDRLATGVWIVRRWRIRMPAAELRSGPAARAGGQEVVLVGIHETGGEVRTVIGADGRLLSEATGAVLYGTVMDSRTGRPVAGAVVAVPPTGRTATTGEDGAFRMTDLSAGIYEVEVRYGDRDLMGLGPSIRSVELEPGRAARLPVDIAPTPALAAVLCARSGWAPAEPGRRPVLLHGVVVGEDSVPVPNALVRIAGDAPDGPVDARVLADVDGVYRVCLDASDGPITVSAGPADRVVEDARQPISLRAAGFVRADVLIPTPAPGSDRAARADAAGADAAWRNAILGTVIAEGTREPVVGAMVTLVDSAGQLVRSAITDPSGRFRFAHPDRGQLYDVRVEHVAFAVAEGRVRFERSEQLRVDVALSSRAIDLEPIVVTERRRGVLADAGFYERRARGMGVFVEMDDARRQRVSNVAELLTGERMIRVVSTSAFGYDIRITGTERLAAGMDGDGGFRDCQPVIYLDGMRVRPSGQPTGYDQALSEIVPPDMVAAVEVFRRPAEVPARFGGSDAACGVVLLWTR